MALDGWALDAKLIPGSLHFDMPMERCASAGSRNTEARHEEHAMNDNPMYERINALAAEEEELWERAGDGDGLDPTQRDRLEKIKVELDQCYDLLHQRQARRSAGLDPDGAEIRPPEIVERYQQ